VPFILAGWRVEPSLMRISDAEQTVRLEPMAMEVLVYLARSPGAVVSRSELEATVWAGKVVGHDAVSNAIIKLRKALGDKARNPHIIETIPKTGYRLIAEVILDSDEAAPDDPAPGQRPRYRWTVSLALGVIAVLAIGIALLWLPRIVEYEPVSPGEMAFPLPEIPSIAVLPFTSLSTDSDLEYFTDGMTDDLITDLSKVSGLFVIARNSVFAYKGKAVNARQVAQELGVRYVMEGSVRRVDNQVRINAQLIDATTGGHDWAERYDGSLDDIFSMQDRITKEIVSALAITLTGYEKEHLEQVETTNPEAYDAFLRGWVRYRQGGPEDLTRALSHFEQAIELDPGYARAHTALAASYWSIAWNGWWRNLDLIPSLAMERTRLALKKALAKPSALAHQVASEKAAHLLRKPDEALAQAKRAIALDSNDPAGHLAMSTALLKADRPAEAVESVRRAMRLDPHYPASYLTRLGQAQFAMGEYQPAAASLETAARLNPDDDWTYVYLTATYGQLGRTQEAKESLRNANVLRAKAGWGALTVLTTLDRYFKWIGDPNPLREGLRKAGVDVGGQWQQLITGVPGQEVKGAITIDVETARAFHDSGVPFIDISFIWFEKRIPDAYRLAIWTGEFNEVRLSELVDKSREFVIYHGGGGSPRRTYQAVAQAVSWGFEKVRYFPQGLDNWDAAGLPIEIGK
jgi:TolB-like protein/DNA-binding winged helix-turn-helix (wHTH) protein/Flp pilus assembly protein TadD/rhodanese-related sulfurtransferase